MQGGEICIGGMGGMGGMGVMGVMECIGGWMMAKQTKTRLF